MNHNGNAHDIDIPAYIAHARDERGRSWRDIETDLWEVYRVAKDHTTVSRIYGKRNKNATPATKTQHLATPVPATLPTNDQTTENAILTPANGVASVAQVLRGVAKGEKAWHKTAPMYAVFFTTVATGCYSFCNTLPAIVGVSLAVLYALYCVDCIRTAGDESDPKEAERARNLIVFVEFVAGIAHYFVFHKFLWRNLESLPFEVYETAKDGAWKMNGSEMEYAGTWVNGEWVGFIAAILAALVFVSAWGAAYAIWRRTKV